MTSDPPDTEIEVEELMSPEDTITLPDGWAADIWERVGGTFGYTMMPPAWRDGQPFAGRGDDFETADEARQAAREAHAYWASRRVKVAR